MDTPAHFFWTYLAFFRNKALRLALLFAILPDILSWGILMISSWFTGIGFDHNLSLIPKWAFTLYGITHSIFVFTAVFLLLWMITKKVPIYAFAWLMHIIMDIPTHSKEFLGTPFLWPVSDWLFPGLSWGTPAFMMTNYTVIILLMILTLKLDKNVFLTFWKRIRKKRKKLDV